MGVASVVVFRVAGRTCGLPASHVVETMRALPIVPLAGRAPGILGLSIVRGDAIPVADAAALFDDRTEGTRRAFVVVRVAGRRVALGVDEVSGVRSIPREGLSALPSLVAGTRDDVVQAITLRDRELLVVLDAGKVLSAEALEALAQASAGARP